MKSSGKLAEGAKQLQALLSGVFPWLSKDSQSVLPILNPKIADEMWLVTSILAVTASAVTFNLSQRFQKPTLGRILCLMGLALSVVSCIVILILTRDMIMWNFPEWQDILARTAFLFLFTGLGLALGYAVSRVF
jgi:hypothetical protein